MHRGIQAGIAASILFAIASGILLIDSRTRLAEAWEAFHAIPSDSDLKVMQAQAGAACRCARKLKSGGGREACWAAFKKNVDRYSHSEWATACEPLSAAGVSFGDGDEISITTSYGEGACTAEEARTLEAVWAETIDPDDPKSFELAESRMDQTVQRFIRGERVAAVPNFQGCSG